MNQHRAQLDRALATRGEDVVLQRRVKNSTPSVYSTLTCRAQLRGYEPHELIGGIVQGDSKVIMSPTAIIADQAGRKTWPGIAGGGLYPVIGDYINARGRLRYVQSTDTIFENGEPIRIEAQVRG
jgi:hypothetical protein